MLYLYVLFLLSLFVVRGLFSSFFLFYYLLTRRKTKKQKKKSVSNLCFGLFLISFSQKTKSRDSEHIHTHTYIPFITLNSGKMLSSSTEDDDDSDFFDTTSFVDEGEGEGIFTHGS